MSDLPSKWSASQLGEICEINPRMPVPPDPGMAVSFVPMPAVSEVYGTISKHQVRPFAEVAKGYTRFQDGDVIFAKITPCMENGKIALAEQLYNGHACGSTEFHVLRSKGQILAKYLWNYLRQIEYRKTAARHMTGAVGQRRVPVQFLRDTIIPLPPLEEQKRIVAKLDSLFFRSRTAREELTRVPRLVERYKEAMLRSAACGELTADWRLENGSPAWREALIKEVSDVVTGFTPSTKERSRFFGGNTPFFKPTDLDAGYCVRQAREHLTDEGVNTGRRVPAGSTLVTCIGATIGKTGLARVDCCTNQQINAVVPNSKYLNEKWLYWMIVSPPFQEAIISNSSATTLPIINKGKFQTLKLSIPSLVEQAEIVMRLEDKFSHMDKLARETSRAMAFIDRLEKTTLAKAFRGDLVNAASMLMTVNS